MLIFPSLGIIFNVFYQVDIAHFFLVYLYTLPDGG